MNNLTQILDTTIQTHLIAAAINQPLAASIAKTIIDDLVHRFGGQMFYLPNYSRQLIAEKHKQILADFDGSNHLEIYQKYKIGSSWLKKLLKRAAKNEPIS